MLNIRITESGTEGKVSQRELNQLASDVLMYHNTGGQVVPGQYGSRLKGAFTHIGSITESGRTSYSKFSAVFGPARYPGSNCGISILGSGTPSRSWV